MLSEQQKLEKIIQLGSEVARVSDLDLLLERVLELARGLVHADGGSIYIRDKEKNELGLRYAQNDTAQKKLPVGRKLVYTLFTMPISNESIAGYVANTGRVLNIPDVYGLDDRVPYRFNKGPDEVSGYRSRSMLTVPLQSSRGDVVGILQMINAKDERGHVVPFPLEDEPLVLHFANSAAIALERAQMTRTIILRMISMARLRDPKETGPHVNRVSAYAVETYEAWARKRGASQEEIDAQRDILRMAAMLHDVGKVAISDAILMKPGKLTAQEFEIMKGHTHLGARLYASPSSRFDEAAAAVALDHHEWWDGSDRGYPGHIDPQTGRPLQGCENDDGTAPPKRGEEISVFGRVVAIADVYDALCSKRCYKEALEEPKALEIIRQERGRQFDPEMVDAFFSSLDMIRSIAQRYPDGPN